MKVSIRELAELINHPHGRIDKVFSNDKKWMIEYRPNFNVIIKYINENGYVNVGYYDDLNKTVGIFPEFMEYHEKIICAFWLAKGEILLNNEQYAQGYSSILPTVIKLSSDIRVDFLNTSVTAVKNIKEKECVVHEFIIQKGDEYETHNKKSEFHYRVKLLYIVYEKLNKRLTHYYKKIVSPLEIPEIIQQLDYDTLIMNYPDEKVDITKRIIRVT